MASSIQQHIQFENWTTQEVADWLQGLDDAVVQYVEMFGEHGIDGKKLLMLSHSDLEKIGIHKLGHQELVLEAVELLRSLRYTHDTENLQSLALQLGCKARSLQNEIQARHGENDKNRANMSRGNNQRKRLSIVILSCVADILTTLKSLVSWLDRPPFEGIYDVCRLRNSIVQFGLEMVTVTQRENSFGDPEEHIMKACRDLTLICDTLVMNAKDPLVVQPASLEQATIRKKQGEELGMNIQSAYNGIHGISSIKELSPADLCNKIEKGDEVLQVNGQTVLGWQLKQLVKILKEKPKEVTLLLKKRPRHNNPLGNMPNHKRLAAKHAQQASTLPKSLKKRRSREGDIKQPRPSLQEYVSASVPTEDIYVNKDRTEGDGNDTDNDVFRSGSESPQYTLPVMPDAKHRRATVSGGSPTFDHPSLIVEDFDPVIRPKSQAVNQAERRAVLASLASSQNTVGMKMPEEKDDLNKQGLAGRKVSGRKEASDSSSNDPKGQTPAESNDTVFVSLLDREKEFQGHFKPPTNATRQEFRVTKPTPVAIETSAVTHGDPSAVYSKWSSAKSPLPNSPLTKVRPPSPVTAPPKRKKPPSSTSSQSPDDDAVKPSMSVIPGVTVTTPNETSLKSPGLSKLSPLSPGTSGSDTPTPTEATRAFKPLPPTSETHEMPVASPVVSASDISLQTLTVSQAVTRPVCSESNLLEKSKPLLLQTSVMEQDNRSHSVRREIHTEVATDTRSKDTPQLVKIKKIDLFKALDVENSHSDEEVTPKGSKKVEFAEDTKESGSSQEVSYTHIVVGGVLQKIPIDKSQMPGMESPPVKMRQKSGSRRLDRRVSCKDLGKGDCEGWLYKRKEKDPVLAKHWNKRWCVLKNSNLYYYKDRNDLKAEGVIFLPAFQVSPAPMLKTKKLAFKVHNTGTTFYFASERQDDMSKWMNKMGLAAISFDTSQMVTTGGFIKPEPRSNHLGMQNIYYSESEDEDDKSSRFGSLLSLESNSSFGSTSTLSSPSSSRKVTGAHDSRQNSALESTNDDTFHHRKQISNENGTGTGQKKLSGDPKMAYSESVEDLQSFLRAIQKEDLTVDGVDRQKRRTCHISTFKGYKESEDEKLSKLRKLVALKRTLKAKEQEVQDIDRLLSIKITSNRLNNYLAYHTLHKIHR